MMPFESIDEAIWYGEDSNAGEFCCVVLWNGRRYIAHIDRGAAPLKISLYDHKDLNL